MKKLMIGMVMSAALAMSPMMIGCGGECDKQCDKFIKCMKDMAGGKWDSKKGDKLKKECKTECKKDKKKFKKQLEKLCGK